MGCVQFLYKFETKRLVLVVGLLLIVVLALQSSSLPYGSVLLSLLSFKSMTVVQPTVLHNSTSVVLGEVNNTEGIDARKSVIKGEGEKDQPYVSQAEENEISDFEESAEPKQALSHEEVQKFDTVNGSLRLANSSNAQTDLVSQPLVTAPMAATSNLTFLGQYGEISSQTDVSAHRNISSPRKEVPQTLSETENAVPLQTGLSNSIGNSTIISDTAMKEKRMVPPTSISEMNSLLLQSRVSSRAMRPQWSATRDQEVLFVRSQIENAPRIESDPGLYASLYRNVSMFKRSYELMEDMLKVYVYNEGEKPIFHQPKLNWIYASEGWFMKLMEGNSHYVVKDPTKAHLFYLPFSSHNLRLRMSEYSSHHKNLAEFLKKYVDMIAEKYRFWNRTGGADHFFVACHDWAPQITTEYMGTCIRALCNANVAKAFEIGKDVSLPVTKVQFADDPLRSLGGKPPSKRPFLAFFAGGMHGYVRPVLLQYWENKDPDMKISGPLPRNAKFDYIDYMKSSRYCICARGYQVHTPRVVEAIFHECVPVIISDNYVPPFFEVLNWEAFSVFVLERDIPNLKKILLSIPKRRYLEMQMRVKKVQKHFLWHKRPVKHDVFHMTLHSIWFNRVFQIVQ